jgi:hypothetical protein
MLASPRLNLVIFFQIYGLNYKIFIVDSCGCIQTLKPSSNYPKFEGLNPATAVKNENGKNSVWSTIAR